MDLAGQEPLPRRTLLYTKDTAFGLTISQSPAGRMKCTPNPPYAIVAVPSAQNCNCILHQYTGILSEPPPLEWQALSDSPQMLHATDQGS